MLLNITINYRRFHVVAIFLYSFDFYFFFTDVGYYEGPLNWKGASLRQANAQASLNLLVKLGMVHNFLLDDPDTRSALADSAKLYLFRTKLTTIRLIAGQAMKLDTLPEGVGE